MTIFPLKISFSAYSENYSSIMSELGFLNKFSKNAGPPSNGGEQAFFSSRLSATNKNSCSSCHNPKSAWSAISPLSFAFNHINQRSTPSLFHSKEVDYLFWDGRAASLEAQVMEVIENGNEMDSSRIMAAKYALEPARKVPNYCNVSSQLAHKIQKIPNSELSSSKYKNIYNSFSLPEKNEIDKSFACVAHEISIFIRKIPYPDNIWSNAVSTNDFSAIESNNMALSGAKLFVGKAGCSVCHYGLYLSDGQFHNIGIGDIKNQDISDPGRFQALKEMEENPYNILANRFYPEYVKKIKFNISEESWGAFRTPSLLQVRLKSAYMHNGKFRNLYEVVHYYNTLSGSVIPPHHYTGVLKPLKLTSLEEKQLVEFLNTL